MAPTNTDLTLKLFVVLHRAFAAVEKHVEADIHRHGLSQAEFSALEALYHKGDLLVGELQRKVLKSSGGITYVVDRLQEKGLVERKPCATDRRAIYAALTAKGRTMMEGIFPVHTAALVKALGGLTKEEKATAVELLRRLGRGAAERPLPGQEEEDPAA